MNNNNPFKTLKFPVLHKKFPELHKNKIEYIDRDKIPRVKAQWSKEDIAELGRSLLESFITPCLVEEGDNTNYTELVSKLTDDEAIEIVSKIANAMLGTIDVKKENLALNPEVTLDKMVKGEKDDSLEIAVSFGISGDIALEKDNDGNNIIKSIKPKSFNLIAQPLAPKIKERLCGELGIGEIPDDIAVQVRLCKTWLESKSFFEKPTNEMTDWEVLMLTTSALTCPDDAAEKYHILITSKDVEEATKDYDTTTTNFDTVFGKPE